MGPALYGNSRLDAAYASLVVSSLFRTMQYLFSLITPSRWPTLGPVTDCLYISTYRRFPCTEPGLAHLTCSLPAPCEVSPAYALIPFEVLTLQLRLTAYPRTGQLTILQTRSLPVPCETYSVSTYRENLLAYSIVVTSTNPTWSGSQSEAPLHHVHLGHTKEGRMPKRQDRIYISVRTCNDHSPPDCTHDFGCMSLWTLKMQRP